MKAKLPRAKRTPSLIPKMTENSLQQWLSRLESRHPKKIDLGLQRIAEVAARLNLVPLSVPAITIAGTNGKGSTAAVLEAMYCQLGRKTPGVFSSPRPLAADRRLAKLPGH